MNIYMKRIYTAAKNEQYNHVLVLKQILEQG